MDTHFIDQLINSGLSYSNQFNQIMVSLQRTMVLAALINLAVLLGIAFFIFQAGRWYERSLTSKHRHDDYWEPKEPTL